jgi:hypothetical protein
VAGPFRLASVRRRSDLWFSSWGRGPQIFDLPELRNGWRFRRDVFVFRVVRRARSLLPSLTTLARSEGLRSRGRKFYAFAYWRRVPMTGCRPLDPFSASVVGGVDRGPSATHLLGWMSALRSLSPAVGPPAPIASCGGRACNDGLFPLFLRPEFFNFCGRGARPGVSMSVVSRAVPSRIPSAGDAARAFPVDPRRFFGRFSLSAGGSEMRFDPWGTSGGGVDGAVRSGDPDFLWVSR